MENILSIILVIIHLLAVACFIGSSYCFYQIARTEKVYKIRINWIDTKDSRYPKYTYNEMFIPSPSNWFGLKYPNDSQFK